MSILGFFSGLAAPSIERNRLVHVFEETMRKMEKLTLKTLQINDAPYKDIKLHATLDSNLRRPYGPNGYRGDPHRFMRDTLTQLLSQQRDIVRLIENTFNKNIDIDQISYEKAHLIQYVSAAIFVNEYILRYTYAVTGMAVKDLYRKQGTINDYAAFCGDLDNLKTFSICLGAMSYKAKDLSQALKPLRDISFDPETHQSLAVIRNKEIDPLSMNLIPIVGHASLLVGELLNSYAEWSYKLAESQMETAELNIMYLERDKAGASPEELAAIEDRILKHRGVVSKAEARMEALKEQ
ncbi:virion structural protein [Vibrio phage BONAISHI]|nr:virion structural protein [Vibrio phage BONAISHI]